MASSPVVTDEHGRKFLECQGKDCTTTQGACDTIDGLFIEGRCRFIGGSR